MNRIGHSLLVHPAILIGYWRLLEDTPLRSERRCQPLLEIVGPDQIAVRVGDEALPPLTEAQIEDRRAEARAEESRWPDPRQFVDPTWASNERRLVIDFLQRCTLVNPWRGLSTCRFCGQMNGSAEMTDGVYCWPEGLAHYLDVHEVRLPDEFVTHVHDAQNPMDMAPPPSFDELGQRDRSWPGSEFGLPIWEPDDPTEFEWYVDADATWWISLHSPADNENT